MKLAFNGRRVAMPPEGAASVRVPEPCACGCDMVHGVNPVDDDRSYTSRAICDGCGADRGKLRLVTDTLFGHARTLGTSTAGIPDTSTSEARDIGLARACRSLAAECLNKLQPAVTRRAS